MSRVRNTIRSLISGYATLGANVLYTLLSVPLALHYLSKDEFGLWALVMQITAYLLLLEMGMTGSVARFLIDYKDHPEAGDYGSLITTGSAVFMVQGLCILAGGSLLSLCLPGLLHVPAASARVLQVLVATQAAIIGAFFVGRIFSGLLQAHQRFDVMGYMQIVQLAASLGAQWLTFHLGWGLYSLLAASFLSAFLETTISLLAVWRLRLFPSRRGWGRPRLKVFKEVFAYSNDLFLLMVGSMLLNASQVIIVSRELGMSAAAVWSIATKTFQVAYQFVQRIFDYSASALAEMIVRGETLNLRRRFRDVLLLTASCVIFSGASTAVCNGAFLQVWTKGAVFWPWRNDALMAVWLLLNCVNRCYICMAGYAKDLNRIRWVYLLEGICFVVTASLTVSRLGMSGIISMAILSNLIWSGSYGVRWAKGYFRVKTFELLGSWLGPAWRYLVLMLVLSFALGWGASRVPGAGRLVIEVGVMAVGGTSLLWLFGLSEELRQEIKHRAGGLMNRSGLRLPRSKPETPGIASDG
jgi:O-antigen/teichoic acid export membrane protein